MQFSFCLVSTAAGETLGAKERVRHKGRETLRSVRMRNSLLMMIGLFYVTLIISKRKIPANISYQNPSGFCVGFERKLTNRSTKCRPSSYCYPPPFVIVTRSAHSCVLARAKKVDGSDGRVLSCRVR